MAETTSRILELLGLLQTHRQWAGPDLAARLGVTERTLRRDIEKLRSLGYTVAAERGAAGGYRLEAGAQLPPLLLTDEEAVTTAIGLRAAATQALDGGEPTTLSALAKFEQLLPPGLRERVNAIAGQVRSQAPRGASISSELVGQLALACRDRHRIRFHYLAGDGAQTDRTVEPHSLVAAERHWFLVGWDLQREAWRTFRVGRMSHFFDTRVLFAQRELPATDAAEFVASAVSSLRDRVRAEAVLRMPLAVMRQRFGPWARGATAQGDTTVWPISGESMELALASLVWIPADVEYELRGSEAFLEFARGFAARMSRASERGRTHRG